MKSFRINNRMIASGKPVYVIAEMSANHGGDLARAVRIIEAAAEAGADAVKLQTYTPDTLTIDCDNECFRIKGTPWQGRTLYDLYREAQTPWEWHRDLLAEADRVGIDLFSTPFDETAVAMLEDLGMIAYKISSFEIVDLPLLRRVAVTGKPVIMSTGMATLAEISEAVGVLRVNGCKELALLKCVSSYPADYRDMNLKTIPHLAEAFGVVTGVSDHTLGLSVPITAVALGACIVEKHFTLSRADGGPDSAFSLEPDEFRLMVEGIRQAEAAVGEVSYEISEKEKESRVFRRSLFVVKDMAAGELFSRENIRSIRPGHGLHTRYLDEIIGRRASVSIRRGTPLAWQYVE